MIGVGISLLSVYALGKYNDKVGDYNYSQECLNFFRNISWSNQSEIEVNASKNKGWLIFLGSTLMVFAILIGSAEAAILVLGMDTFGGFKGGQFIGLSIFFFITGSICLISAKKPTRKMIILLIIFGFISFIGSIVLTIVTRKFFGVETLFPNYFFRNKADKFDLYFATNANGNYYFPLWPYHYLLTVMCTLVVTVIALSTASMIICLNILITFKDERSSNETAEHIKNNPEDIGFKFIGFLLMLLGFGYLMSTL